MKDCLALLLKGAVDMGTVCYTVVNGEVLSENRGGVKRDYLPDTQGNTKGATL